MVHKIQKCIALVGALVSPIFISSITCAEPDSAVTDASALAVNACNDTRTPTAGIQTTEAPLLAALRLISVRNFTHEYEQPQRPNQPPPNPPGGTHPYEWDSIRTAEQMLHDRNGGSCGTHALSIQALARAAGIPTENILIVGAVQSPDYRDICPKGRAPRRTIFTMPDGERSDIHPANGHVFVLVNLSGKWQLFNSTHNPDTHGTARRNPAAACNFKLSQFEKVDFYDPATIRSSFTSQKPIKVPLDSFPSLKEWLLDDSPTLPDFYIFALWKLEDYPVHTIKDRLNLVASGEINNSVCRWNP